MTNEIQLFTNPEFGNIRTINENGKVLFCGKDVAEVLGYKNVYDALSQHCPSLVKREVWVKTGVRVDGTTAKRNTEMSFIPEGDVIRLILRSTLPSAQKFEREFVGLGIFINNGLHRRKSYEMENQIHRSLNIQSELCRPPKKERQTKPDTYRKKAIIKL